MAITEQELEEFHLFAKKLVKSGKSYSSLDELLYRWVVREEGKEAVTDAIRGLRDVASRKTRGLDEFLRDFRNQRNIPTTP